MKMAKASQEDLEMALELASALEDIERGMLPHKMVDDACGEWIDTNDARQYARLVEFLQETLDRGSIFRVVFGMAVLCDPKNKLIDPDADTLEHHPDIVAALAAQPKRDDWIDPNDKSRAQYLPHIGEPCLFCHDGRVYYGKHTGGSFTAGAGFLAQHFDTWKCVWRPMPAAPSALAATGAARAEA